MADALLEGVEGGGLDAVRRHAEGEPDVGLAGHPGGCPDLGGDGLGEAVGPDLHGLDDPAQQRGAFAQRGGGPAREGGRGGARGEVGVPGGARGHGGQGPLGGGVGDDQAPVGVGGHPGAADPLVGVTGRQGAVSGSAPAGPESCGSVGTVSTVTVGSSLGHGITGSLNSWVGVTRSPGRPHGPGRPRPGCRAWPAARVGPGRSYGLPGSRRGSRPGGPWTAARGRWRAGRR